MSPAVQIALWWLAFAGSHMVMSHPPVRSALARRLGEPPFLGLYSLVSFATFVPLVSTYFAHRETRAVSLSVLATVPGTGWLTMALMVFALVLVVLGLTQPSPALIGAPGASGDARGVLRITRNPLFTGIAIFAVAHLLVNHTALDRAFFGGLLGFSVIGTAHQDWRKRMTGGEAMRRFYEETSFLPFAAIVAGRNRLEPRELLGAGLAAALALFAVVFFWLHDWLFG